MLQSVYDDVSDLRLPNIVTNLDFFCRLLYTALNKYSFPVIGFMKKIGDQLSAWPIGVHVPLSLTHSLTHSLTESQVTDNVEFLSP